MGLIGLALLVLGCVALLNGCETRTKKEDGDDESDPNIVHGTIKPIEPDEDGDNSEIEVSTGSDASSDAEAEFEEDEIIEQPFILTGEQEIFIITVVGEAGEGNIDGQNAVAHTIMNRVNNPEVWYKPTTVTEVITKELYQYDAWDNPNFPAKWAKDKIENCEWDDPQFEEIVDRLLNIYNETTSDNTGGATSFYSPKYDSNGNITNKPSWANAMTEVTPNGSYGNLKFYKE